MDANPARSKQLSRYYGRQAAPQVTRSYAMWSFIANNHDPELHLRATWQPVQLKKQRCYMAILRYAYSCLCHCILDQDALQGQPPVEHLVVVQV